MPKLTDPIALGAIAAPNRMLMSPLTRARGMRSFIATPLMGEYYAQRASAGLIVSEAIAISRQGMGWAYATGLWSDDQTRGWLGVTNEVHGAGGRIVAQLWHMGRLVHPDFLDGAAPVSSSATTAPGHAHTYDGSKPYGAARALDASEIPALLDDYERAATNAMAAGFDGVQLHAANGYLLDQFLRDGANLRDDGYGGSIENRVRLLGEVTDRLVAAVGADRVGVRLSPKGDSQGVDDSDPYRLFPVVAERLNQAGIAWLELREPRDDGSMPIPPGPPVHPLIRKVFTGPLVLNGGYDGASAQAALDEGAADAITFGRAFIANPDLPRRIELGAPLASPDPETFYSQGAKGYIDYPALAS